MGDRPPELVQYREKDGEGDHRWHVIGGMNHDEPISSTTEGYRHEADMQTSVLLTLDAILNSNVRGVDSRVLAHVAKLQEQAPTVES